MFIYKFMAGVVETFTGGAEEDTIIFDPHAHRVIEKPTSYLDTMIHLLKASIGAGILCMPDAVRRLGLINGVIAIPAIGFFATYCIQLLIIAQYKICQREKRGYMAYPKSMLFALQSGPPCLRWSAKLVYYFVDIVLVTWQLGICVIYFVFVAENLKQVCDHYNLFEASLRLHLCLILGPLILINLIKDLKMMTPMSTVSNIVTIFGLILVFFYLVEDDVSLPDDAYELKSLVDIPVFIGITLFALEAVGVILALEYNMDCPKKFTGICGLFNLGMIVIMILYTLVGVFGYLKYGNNIKASITLNLPSDQKKAQVAKVLFGIAIFLSFPLQNFVAYAITWRKIKKKISEKRSLFVDYLLRIVLVLIPFAVAVAVPTLGPFISLFGALCLSLLAIVFPGLIDACVWYPTTYGVFKYKLFRDITIILVGMFALISGCYTSIMEIIQDF
ncbi:proton-coupled amino acid transporter-like protein CG1139 [Galleria mellonella]|uniref:Proton-coupled amino acid transporter-like protein CG1139 n=1 Tax=Galleria mellonella TaxID=7137 RepID=A0ABM3MMU8_GALME|nr:proton-coupled amino acid transporter-like protein CG1139 [Galleria mellonella]